MLPSELLLTRRWKGFIKPRFASINAQNIALVKEILTTYQRHIGHKKREIQADLLPLEDAAWHFKFVRGIATLIDRRCVFSTRAATNPEMLRREIFSLVHQKGIPFTEDERLKRLTEVATKLGLTLELSTAISTRKKLWSTLLH